MSDFTITAETVEEYRYLLAAQALARMAPAPREAPAPLSPQKLTREEFAAHVKRHVATIDRWVTDGMPFELLGARKMFDLDACAEWHVERASTARQVRERESSKPTAGAVGVVVRTRGGRR